MLFVIYSYPGAIVPAITKRGMFTRLSPSQRGKERIEEHHFEMTGIPAILYGPVDLLRDFRGTHITLGHYYEIWRGATEKRVAFQFCLNLTDVERFPNL